MKRKELKIMGLSYSQSQVGSYVIVLSDDSGSRKLPLIIKPLEAQRIALELEGIKSPRPLTHDLIKSMTDIYGIDIQEVFIHALVEGIFYTRLLTSNGVEEAEIECTAGDAIALSVIYECPIFTTKEILETAGIIVDEGDVENRVNDVAADDGGFSFDDFDEGDFEDIETDRIVSIDDLEKVMEAAIENEEYEIAAEIRDRIQELKEKE